MSRAFSIYLDLVRFAAAIVVLLSHIAYTRFTGGDYGILRELNLGSDAVVVFFVLSGLVIAYAAEREGSGGNFAFRRATRLLSVAGPALVLTLALDSFGARLAPAAYDGWWYNPLGVGETLIRGLTFSNEWSFVTERLGTNGPYWSLSYEAGYYLLFGAAFFTQGALRVALLAAIAAVVGPRVLLLMPIWLFGVLAWRAIAGGQAAAIPRVVALAVAIGCPALYVACLAVDLPGLLAGATQALFEPMSYRYLLRFSDEFLWNTLIGALVALQFLGMARLCEGLDAGRAGPAIRWLAGASFSIYAVHYPALQFVDAALPEATPLRHLALLVLALAICFAFAELFERRLGAFRRALVRIAQPSPQILGSANSSELPAGSRK